MATNRFDVGLNPIQIGTPVQIPFEEITMALGAQQQKYDQTKALLDATEEKNFQNLQNDADFAAKARQEQQALVDNLLSMNQGDLAKSSSEIQSQVRKFARRFGPAGDIGAMQLAYNKAQEEFKKIEDSDLPSIMKEKAKQQMLDQYGNVMNNAKQDAFGNTIYNQFGSARVPDYVNVEEEAMKLAKEVPIEKIATTSGWFKSNNGVWYKNSGMTEKVTFNDIKQAVMPLVLKNSKVVDYLDFEANLNTYKLNQSDLQLYNEGLRQATFDKNKALMEQKGEIINKLNDPSKFKSAREYQNYINSIFGEKVINVDGNIGDKTREYKDRAIELVNQKMQPDIFEQRDLSGVRADYINRRINEAVSSAAGFYEQYNITKKDQDMKFDPYDLYAYQKGFEDEYKVEIGDLTPSLARQTPFDSSPWAGGIGKVKNGAIELNTSEKAVQAMEDAQREASYAKMNPYYPGFLKSLWYKGVAAWNATFNKNRADASDPEIANAIKNAQVRADRAGINTDGMTEDDWLQRVAGDMEMKLNAAGQQYYNVVKDGKSQKNWEEVWGEEIRKNGDQTLVTNPVFTGREIHGTGINKKTRSTRVTGDQLRDAITAQGPISYAGTNLTVDGVMEYGTDVIQIGEEQFYVSPSPTVKMTAPYFADRVLAAKYGLADASHFQAKAQTTDGLPVLADYRSFYNAEDDTYTVEIQTGNGWVKQGTFTEAQLINQNNGE